MTLKVKTLKVNRIVNEDAAIDDHPTRHEFLTARQLAAILQVSESTVRRLAREGRIPVIRLTPRLARYHLESVRKALDGERQTRVRRANAVGNNDAQLSFEDLL